MTYLTRKLDAPLFRPIVVWSADCLSDLSVGAGLVGMGGGWEPVGKWRFANATCMVGCTKCPHFVLYVRIFVWHLMCSYQNTIFVKLRMVVILATCSFVIALSFVSEGGTYHVIFMSRNGF